MKTKDLQVHGLVLRDAQVFKPGRCELSCELSRGDSYINIRFYKKNQLNWLRKSNGFHLTMESQNSQLKGLSRIFELTDLFSTIFYNVCQLYMRQLGIRLIGDGIYISQQFH